MSLDDPDSSPCAGGRLRHGGRLREAAARWGIPPDAWLDLSTGINPHGWPVPELAASLWSRLPEEDDDLLAAAAEYYGSAALLPVAGSQAAIQALPRLRPPSRVAVLAPAYAEHAQAWRRAGHDVTEVPADRIDAGLAAFEVLVLVHPNNPTGATFPRAVLDEWQGRLAARGGWLAVDEAFMDATPERSLLPDSPREGLILLRSLGKFFGLAGARVGFASASPGLLARLDALLGPWTIATPARLVAAAALRDRAWQAAMRQRLPVAGERLRTLLRRHGLPPAGGGALFQWVPVPEAAALHEALARRAILTRLFDDPPSLRFGLPGAESDWTRLELALADLGRGSDPAPRPSDPSAAMDSAAGLCQTSRLIQPPENRTPMQDHRENLRDRAARIRLLILDVDGVLTDGSLFLGPDGQEFKAFNARDGHGMVMLREAGVTLAVITGRTSEAVRTRMEGLGVVHVMQGRRDKLAAYEELASELSLADDRIAYVGDDVVDLPPMGRVGLPIAVADAHPLVRRAARWSTGAPGGRGAVREVCEFILDAQGHSLGAIAAAGGYPRPAGDVGPVG